MNKQTYLTKCKTIQSLKEAVDALTVRWNEEICWYGTDEEQLQYNEAVKHMNDKIFEIRKELEEARESIDREELLRWRAEYKNYWE